MLLAEGRIELDARAAPARAAPWEVVAIGHCPSAPGQPDGARWDRVARDAAMLAEIAAAGFADEARRLAAFGRGETPPEPPPALGLADAELKALLRLPLPIRSLGHFQVLFPDAFDAPTLYASAVAGRRAWLPAAVQDFFGDSDRGFDETRTLWVIRVPESEGLEAMLPSPAARRDARAVPFAEPGLLSALERALLLRRAGVLLLPDLERLQIPSGLPDEPPRVRLANLEPAFVPLGQAGDDDHRERRRADEMPTADRVAAPEALLLPLLRVLERHRPDLMLLLALPFEAPAAGAGRTAAAGPAADAAWLSVAARAGAAFGDALRQVQLVFPLLASPLRHSGAPTSPGGAIAGLQVRTALRHGPWRSAAARALPPPLLPWPAQPPQHAAALRVLGVSPLVARDGRAWLDDESLPAPVLPQADLSRMTRADRERGDWRSAEIQRFVGWVRRELRELGERLVFDVDPDDPRPQQALHAFCARLHQAGALRGRRPEDAFRIRRLVTGEVPDSAIGFELELAPAYPIDRITLSFLHDRADGTLQVA